MRDGKEGTRKEGKNAPYTQYKMQDSALGLDTANTSVESKMKPVNNYLQNLSL